MKVEKDDGSRGRFLATMSHDIRTPLTAVRGALGLLERKDAPPEVARQMVEMLRRASSRFERLAFGLVAVDQIDDGSMPLLIEVCDVRGLVADAVASFRREHDLIEVRCPDSPVNVACDRDRTLQALDHLLDNARKFGGPTGTVTVAVMLSEGYGAVLVSDEGPGVGPGDRDRIFERYVQIGDRLPNEPRGAGIGLYLARWGARAMRGDLELLDTPGGATFKFSLPALPGLDGEAP